MGRVLRSPSVLLTVTRRLAQMAHQPNAILLTCSLWTLLPWNGLPHPSTRQRTTPPLHTLLISRSDSLHPRHSVSDVPDGISTVATASRRATLARRTDTGIAYMRVWGSPDVTDTEPVRVHQLSTGVHREVRNLPATTLAHLMTGSQRVRADVVQGQKMCSLLLIGSRVLSLLIFGGLLSGFWFISFGFWTCALVFYKNGAPILFALPSVASSVGASSACFIISSLR